MSSRAWVAVVLTLLVAGCVTDGGYQAARQAPSCQYQPPLTYAPVRLHISAQADYPVQDLRGYELMTPWLLYESLNEINPGKYQLGDGRATDIALTFTMTYGGAQYYGARIEAYLPRPDSWFRYSWPPRYASSDDLYDDVTDMIDQFVTQGWSYGAGNC
jgi:hypothetical protein